MAHRNHCDWPARHAALLDGEASGVCGPSNQRTGKLLPHNIWLYYYVHGYVVITARCRASRNWSIVRSLQHRVQMNPVIHAVSRQVKKEFAMHLRCSYDIWTSLSMHRTSASKEVNTLLKGCPLSSVKGGPGRARASY